MSRMKTFTIYLLLFIGLYVVSNLLITAYINSSYYKIESYEINESQLTVTIMSAKASKDNGYIEGKISNGTNEKVENKYMKVELFSENNVSLGKEYVKVEQINPGELKNFKVSFSCDNVKHFIITFLTQEQKDEEDASKSNSLIPNFEVNEKVNSVIESISPNK